MALIALLDVLASPAAAPGHRWDVRLFNNRPFIPGLLSRKFVSIDSEARGRKYQTVAVNQAPLLLLPNGCLFG
jgi:hypothetical protein